MTTTAAPPTTTNLTTHGGQHATPPVLAALNFTDALNEAMTLPPGGNGYIRLHDLMLPSATIETGPSSMRAYPEQRLTHSLSEQLALLEGMKGVLKEFRIVVDRVVDGGGGEFGDERVLLVRVVGGEGDGKGEVEVTTEEAQGAVERAGLPRIEYVKEFMDSAYLKGFMAAEMGGASGGK